MKTTKQTKQMNATLNGAGKELEAILGGFKVVEAEMRRTFGKPSRLYIRMEEILKPVQLKIG